MADPEPDPNAQPKSCTFTFKKTIKRAGQNMRKRETDEKEKEKTKSDNDSYSDSSSSSSSEEGTKIVRATKRSRRANPMVQSTGAGRRAQKKESSSSSSASNGEGDADDEDSQSKDPKSRVGVYYESSNTAESGLPRDMGATAILQTETEKDRDAQAIFEKSLEINKEQKGKADDGIYRGLANYTRYYDKKDTAAGNAASGSNRTKGPIRAPENLRATVRWDYQPDICKDYKETGFCGFGDSCKFLHDRSDYKFGWQLEREVAEGKYGQDDDEAGKYEIPDEEDELPFKCFICRESFKSPVVTKCKHYFCESCALAHYRKSLRCFVCGQQTRGLFNPAKEIIARLKNEEAEAAAAAAGGGGSDNDSSD